MKASRDSRARTMTAERSEGTVARPRRRDLDEGSARSMAVSSKHTRGTTRTDATVGAPLADDRFRRMVLAFRPLSEAEMPAMLTSIVNKV